MRKKSNKYFGISNRVFIFAPELRKKDMKKQLVNTCWWRYLHFEKS
ncbi:epimerase [Bacteroides sp. 519]|nr:epimerase [Bacteroides sp. 519]